jgi:hypothetical protein
MMCPRLPLATLLAAALLPLPAARAQLGINTATNVQVSTLTTGTVLQVSAAMSGDGRYVTMTVDPQFSTLEGLDTIVVQNPNGAGNIVQAIGNRRVPFRSAQVGKVTLVEKDKPLLAAPAPALNLPATSLKAAVRKLADETRANIVLGIKGLEEAGVDVNAPRDFSIPAGTTRETLLALLKTATPETDMVITAEDRVLSIATQAQADNAVVTKTYYLEDLLANLPRFVSPDTNLNQLGGRPLNKSLDFSGAGTSRAAVTSTGPYSNLFTYRNSGIEPASDISSGRGGRRAARNAPPKPNPSTSITEVITSTVRPDIWKVNGGKVGEIGVVGNRVTIRAPQSVHALLDGPSHYNPNKLPLYVGYGQ